MTKLTFDVDFNKDPEEILKEIQERAKAEVAKREPKIKYASFLSKLHEKVNEEIGTEFKSVNDLIRALIQFANPKLKEKISSSETGRRVTISMTSELFQEIKSKLSLPNPNKAAIARETGASVVQVRKVANGGYDQKFAREKSSNSPISPSQASSPSKADFPAPSFSLPSPTSEAKDPEPPLAHPPAPSLDLPPLSAELPAPVSVPEPLAEEILMPPSFGEEMANEPAPFAPPPVPEPADAPPSPPLSIIEPSTSSQDEVPVKPSLSHKSKLGLGGNSGKTTLSLKKVKKKPMGLKITRPPMRPPSP